MICKYTNSEAIISDLPIPSFPRRSGLEFIGQNCGVCIERDDTPEGVNTHMFVIDDMGDNAEHVVCISAPVDPPKNSGTILWAVVGNMSPYGEPYPSKDIVDCTVKYAYGGVRRYNHMPISKLPANVRWFINNCSKLITERDTLRKRAFTICTNEEDK